MGAQLIVPCMCCPCNNNEHENCRSKTSSFSRDSVKSEADSSSSTEKSEESYLNRRLKQSYINEERLKKIEEDLIHEREMNNELQKQLSESIDKLLENMSTVSSYTNELNANEEEIKCMFENLKFILNFYHTENLVKSKLSFLNIRHVASCIGCEKCALISKCAYNANKNESQCFACTKARQFHAALAKIENYCGIGSGLPSNVDFNFSPSQAELCQKFKILTKRFKKAYTMFKRSLGNHPNSPSICSLSNVSAITDLSVQRTAERIKIGSIPKSKLDLAPFTFSDTEFKNDSEVMNSISFQSVSSFSRKFESMQDGFQSIE